VRDIESGDRRGLAGDDLAHTTILGFSKFNGAELVGPPVVLCHAEDNRAPLRVRHSGHVLGELKLLRISLSIEASLEFQIDILSKLRIDGVLKMLFL
jgi:hypothetical protein